jgi:hypothetical protein
MKQSIETVTPLDAQVYLQKSTLNRKISKTLLGSLTQSIINDRFVLNGQPIIFDEEGFLIDGQHRLTACLLSDKPIEIAVVRGINKSAFNVIDCGKKRSLGDVLSIAGYKNTHELASLLRYLDGYYNYGQMDLEAFRKQYQDSLHEKILDLAKQFKAAIPCSKLATSSRIVPRTPLAFCLYVCSKIDPNDARDFYINKIKEGQELKQNTPEYVMRRKFESIKTINNSNIRTRIPHGTYIATLLKAWNYHRNGRRIKSIKLIKDIGFDE